MSNLEKTVDEQIIELVNRYKQITIKQIAERLQKDLGQISKRIKILEQKNVVKKIKYSPTGSKQHSIMVQLVSGQVQQNSFIKENSPEENSEIQLDNVNLTDNLTDNLIGQLDSDKLSSIPENDDLDLSDIENSISEKPISSFEKDLQFDILTDEEKKWLSKRIYDKSTRNGKFHWEMANRITKKLNL